MRVVRRRRNGERLDKKSDEPSERDSGGSVFSSREIALAVGFRRRNHVFWDGAFFLPLRAGIFFTASSYLALPTILLSVASAALQSAA